MHTKLSEQLLSILGEKGKLNDKTISIFNSRATRLENVVLQNAQTLTSKGLRVLHNHHIIDLEASALNVTVSDLINSLSEWTVQNLRSFNVSRCTFLDCSKIASMVTLSKLRNLRVLNVSHTEFNLHGLQIVVEDMRLLESLDISETRVTDISPLRKSKNRLQVLVMHNLKISDVAISVIVDLYKLKRLDLSRNSDIPSLQVYVLLEYMTSPLSINGLLSQCQALEDLEYLDISGFEGIDVYLLMKFIQCHPRLMFLGLLDCDTCHEAFLNEASHPFYRKDFVVIIKITNVKISFHIFIYSIFFQVTGSANEDQILESLRRYPKRVRCTQKSLYELFSLTQQFTEPRVDAIQVPHIFIIINLHK